MIDDDDVQHAILAWPVVGPISLVLGIIVIGALWVASCENESECAKRACARGHGKVIDHECLCVERAAP